MVEKAKRKPFIIWKIGEEEYKLKLTTGEISRLEQMYGGSLINLLNTETGMTPLHMVVFRNSTATSTEAM